MIHDLKPYPAMKDSGVPWLGQVPEHWRTLLNQRVFKEKIRSHNNDEVQLSLSQRSGLIATKDMVERSLQTSSFDNWKKVLPGDLVVNRFKAHLGVFFASELQGIVSFHYGVFLPRVEVYTKYFEYLYHTDVYKTLYAAASNGMTIGLQNLSNQNFYNIRTLLPPPSEQAAIVRFLDYADHRIRKAIAAKSRLIKLLQEQKQVIIHQAVTRGLDPNVKLKPSGVEWLGDIPEEWEVHRLKRLVVGRLTYGANLAAEHTNLDWPRYLRITDFRSDGSLKSDTFRSLPPEVAIDYLVNPGDILFARSGATVGKAFIVPNVEQQLCHAGYLIRARPDINRILPEYLFMYSQSRAFSQWKNAVYIQSTIQNIGADKYSELLIPLPSLDVQHYILNYIKIAMLKPDAAISRTQHEITLLREYRTRLIADVVTGKLDVREAAVQLPELTEEAVLEELEVDEEGGLEADEAEVEVVEA